MSKPTLALCIPAYNAANFLPRLLKSAQAQAIPFDEVLVYDDCSSDNTAEVAMQYGAKVIRGDVNVGCSQGKNSLALATSCEYIHFHDADDELLPNFTTLAHKWMALPNTPDVVLFDYEWRDNETKELINTRRFDRERLERDPIEYAIKEQINPFCGLYHRQRFLDAGGYDTDPLVLYNEDVAMHCRLAIRGLSFSAEPEVSIINYRVQASMSSANQEKCTLAKYHVMRKNAEEVGAQYGAAIAHMLWKNAGVAGSLLDWKTADKSLKLALQLNGTKPMGESAFFTLVSKINPFFAIRLREYLIRLFKPYLRTPQIGLKNK